jgi:hypothetical protein
VLASEGRHRYLVYIETPKEYIGKKTLLVTLRVSCVETTIDIGRGRMKIEPRLRKMNEDESFGLGGGENRS